jgi:hypothetical protein
MQPDFAGFASQMSAESAEEAAGCMTWQPRSNALAIALFLRDDRMI